MLKISRYPKISERLNGSSTRFFGTVRQKIATENRDILLVQKFFRYPNFSETQKGSPTKLMGIVRQQKKHKILIPLLSQKI